MTLEDAWFDIYDNGISFQPNVTATVNGYYGTVRKVEMTDPSEYMNVEYHFGQVNDSVIENIIITDVVTPVAGEYPSYNCNLLGSGYHLAAYKDKNYDAYWAGEEWPMIKNGIGWWDVTNGDWHYGNKPFVFGHEYQIRVYVQTDDGYEFYTTGKYYVPAGTAKVNGNAANMEMESMANREQEVRYTFTCQQAEVSEVVVSGIDVPVAGNAPDYTALVGNANLHNFAPYGFQSAGFWWYDSEDSPLTDEDTFVAGETYKLEIKLTPAMIGQVVVSRFQTPVTAILNGKAVDSSDVMANSTTVYIYRTYTCGGTSGVSVLGQVTSFNDASGDVTLQLIPQGLTESAYETIVKGNTVSYSFNNTP